MTAAELAARLTGREYLSVPTRDECALAKAHGLVIVYGESDDAVSISGAADAEVAAFCGATIHFTKAGVLTNDSKDSRCPHFARKRDAAAKVEALWEDDGVHVWVMRTDIPHSTFLITEYGQPFCLGIVFALADAPA